MTFPLFNHADTFYSLVSIPASANYDRFKRNARKTGWVEKLLKAASKVNNGCQDMPVTWILRFLGDNYSDCFVYSANELGLVLPSKIMDAATAAAMWEEANTPLRAQRIILRHLKFFWETNNCTRKPYSGPGRRWATSHNRYSSNR